MKAHSLNLQDAEISSEGYRIAIQVGAALQSMADDNVTAAVEHLLDVRHDVAPLGGSLAQQDLFNMLLVDTVERANMADLAASLVGSRIAKWPRHQPTIAQASRVFGRHPKSDR